MTYEHSQMFDPELGGGEFKPIIFGVILSMISAFVRMMADDSEPQIVRVLLESLSCGLLTITVGYALIAMEMHLGWSIFAGGFIGSMGSTYVRIWTRKVVAKKSGGDCK